LSKANSASDFFFANRLLRGPSLARNEAY